MSGFFYKNESISAPSGLIISYLGKTSPSGWLICDGNTVTSSDGRYADLATILNSMFGVSTNNSNSITLPNLNGRYLYGSADISSLGATSGTSSATISLSNLPIHTHTVSFSSNVTSHNHNFIDYGHTHNNSDFTKTFSSRNMRNDFYDLIGPVSTNKWFANNYARTTPNANTGISVVSNSHTINVNYNNAGNNTNGNIQTIPSSYYVNYIIKI